MAFTWRSGQSRDRTQRPARSEASRRDDVVRIAREAIVNAAMHGAADHVDVVVRERGRELIMSVCDDGSGIADA